MAGGCLIITTPLHEGFWLKTTIRERGIRQEDFTAKLGISRNQLSILMKDQRLSPKYRAAMLSLLGLKETALDEWVDLEEESIGLLGKSNHEDEPDQTNVRSLGVHDPDVYQDVKFVSYNVWATFTDNFGDFDFQDVKTTFPVYLPKLNFPITDRHMVFEILGDSMEERLFSRDVILTELVDEGNFEYLNSWIYVVAYRNQLVVKRVIDNDFLLNGTLTLHSDNKKHGKITIRRDDIRYIWRFNAVIYSTAV